MKIAFPLFAIAALMLSACARSDGVVPLAGGCVSDAGKRTAGVDWGKAGTIDLKLENDQYSPLTINLNKGQAYVLRINNAENKVRGFEARDFFRSVALGGLTIGGKDYGTPCVNTVNIASKGKAELRFVTVHAGEYPFANNTMLVEFPLPLGGAFGYINVN
jgi:hypothetical protein